MNSCLVSNSYLMGGGPVMMLVMLLFWIAILAGGILLARWLWDAMATNKKPKAYPAESALEILKQRYAKGEINQEEFEKLKKDIG